MLRIIGGEKRGAKLETLPGMATRPLRDRVRESLFNILQGRIRGARVLDLFAGSGAVGLEALSRGAVNASFVEAGGPALQVIRGNVEKLGYEDRATVVGGKLPGALSALRASAFELVFVMPPYHENMAPPVLVELAKRGLIAEDGVVIVEIEKSEEWTVGEAEGWRVEDDRLYGVTRLLFLQRA